MGLLHYSAITSLDGYVADADGRFDWSAPDEEVHAYVNEVERPVGTYLYGRRMYDVLVFWETVPLEEQPQVGREYAEIWRAADKIVFSTTLGPDEVGSGRTRVEPSFTPELVRRLKDESATDLSIGGASLAGQALAAGLVDTVRLFLTPVVVGGGTRALPDGVHLDLELLDEQRFGNGVVMLHHAVR